MHYDIWVAVQDPGEAAGILQVIDRLTKAGCSVRLITSGWAASNLNDREQDRVERADILMTDEPPRLFVTGICSPGSVGHDLIPLLRGKAVIVFIQDLWGIEPSYKDQAYRPDYVITNDHIDKEIVCAAWPELDPDQVLITGFPALDAYASMDIVGEGAKARQALGIDRELPVILFAGQGLRTSDALAEVVQVLNTNPLPYCFIPRPHTRMRRDYATEMLPWQKALAAYRGRLVVDWFDAVTTRQLVAACAMRGVVISMYSTVLLEAAVARSQAIAVLYPGVGAKAMHAENGLTRFPLAELGCCALAEDRHALFEHILVAVEGEGRQRSAQEQHIRVDGCNARRAADAILALLR